MVDVLVGYWVVVCVCDDQVEGEIDLFDVILAWVDQIVEVGDGGK